MKRILIVGAGFAGMYAAPCAARLRDEQDVSPDTQPWCSLSASARVNLAGTPGRPR
jgi:hypothetical protein